MPRPLRRARAHSSAPPARPAVAPSRRGRVVLAAVALLTATVALAGAAGPSQAGPQRINDPDPRAAAGLFRAGKPKGKVRVRTGAAREVGMRFSPRVRGAVTGVRVYKPVAARSATPRTGSLWTARGRLLGAARFAKSAGKGWVAVQFSQPVTLRPGKTYVVSAFAAKGTHAVTRKGLARTRTTATLTARSGKNGVYRSRRGTGFPNNKSRSRANYWVDVRFVPGRTTTPPPPPTPESQKCVGEPNTPGGADPWGGCWPGPHNTGYPQGLPGDTRTPVTLTPYNGPTTIRSCGVVIDSKVVDGTLLIEAGNGTTSPTTPCVTIRNSLVKGVIFAEKSSYGPTVIEDTEVAPTDLPFWENIGRSNFFATRVNSHGGQGVIKCESNCVARDSWVHGMELGGAYHYNAFGGNGTERFTIDHNYGSCGDWERVSDPADDAGCSAVIGFYGDYAPIQDITITRNFLASTFSDTGQSVHRQAAYCLNPGYYPGKPYPDTARLTVTDNVFARGSARKCGVYGPSNSLHGRGEPNGSVWERNSYVDGATISRPTE